MALSCCSVPVPMTDSLAPLFERFATVCRAAGFAEGGMGEIEETVGSEALEMQRKAVEAAAQTKADGVDSSRCPRCGTRLNRVTHGHERTVTTRFGPVTLRRSKGYCPRCDQWVFPADEVLGLNKRATASPSVQEASALLVSKMPAAEASAVARRLMGLDLDPSTLDREARRQGQRAEEIRRREDEEACDTVGRWKVTARVGKDLPQTPFLPIIMMDAWMIRERDAWGETQALKEAGQAVPSRWHWVYTATIFRLDQRARTQSDRPMILSRGYVATRKGVEEFSRQVFAEAVRQGLLLCRDALVVCDGGVWLWNLAEDRFPWARKRLDFYHAGEHLWEVAHTLYGKNTPEARAWAEPLIHQLRHGGEAGVVQTLEDLAAVVEEAKREVIEREAKYFSSHRKHLDYSKGAARGEPIGSGAIESTCRQYQCRFKRTGQFWTIEGDEPLLAMETCWRNGRWGQLFPHSITNRYAQN